MANSTHRVEVFRVPEIERHPNADTLGIVRFGGYSAVVKLGTFTPGQLAAYLPPDSVVPETPQFAFLDRRRITVKRLRGVYSMGLLIPAPDGAAEGDDVAEQLGVTHYVPPIERLATGGDCVKGPHTPHYDLEAFRRYATVALTPGENVYVTEKIHGANGRFTFHDGQMFCGSKQYWKKDTETCMWWIALRAHPEVEAYCRRNPGVVVYGEVYGAVQSLSYGAKKGEARIAVFDIWRDGRYIDARELHDIVWTEKLPAVPLLAICPYDFDRLLTMAEGPSCVPGAQHCREGIVIKPEKERWSDACGRIALKIVSNMFLAGDTHV